MLERCKCKLDGMQTKRCKANGHAVDCGLMNISRTFDIVNKIAMQNAPTWPLRQSWKYKLSQKHIAKISKTLCQWMASIPFNSSIVFAGRTGNRKANGTTGIVNPRMFGIVIKLQFRMHKPYREMNTPWTCKPLKLNSWGNLESVKLFALELKYRRLLGNAKGVDFDLYIEVALTIKWRSQHRTKLKNVRSGRLDTAHTAAPIDDGFQ